MFEEKEVEVVEEENLKDEAVNAFDRFKEEMEKNLTKENLEARVKELSAAVGNLIDKAEEKYHQLKESEKTQQYIEKAKETYNKAADSVTEAYNKTYESLSKNETMKNVVEKTKEVVGVAQEKYKNFTHDPKVRAAVKGAVNTLSGMVDTTVEAVKSVVKYEYEDQHCHCCEDECCCDDDCCCDDECHCHEGCCCHEEEKRTEE